MVKSLIAAIGITVGSLFLTSQADAQQLGPGINLFGHNIHRTLEYVPETHNEVVGQRPVTYMGVVGSHIETEQKVVGQRAVHEKVLLGYKQVPRCEQGACGPVVTCDNVPCYGDKVHCEPVVANISHCVPDYGPITKCVDVVEPVTRCVPKVSIKCTPTESCLEKLCHNLHSHHNSPAPCEPCAPSMPYIPSAPSEPCAPAACAPARGHIIPYSTTPMYSTPNNQMNPEHLQAPMPANPIPAPPNQPQSFRPKTSNPRIVPNPRPNYVALGQYGDY